MEEIFLLTHVSGMTFELAHHPASLALEDALYEANVPNLSPGRARILRSDGTTANVNVLFWKMPHFTRPAAYIRASDLNGIGVVR